MPKDKMVVAHISLMIVAIILVIMISRNPVKIAIDSHKGQYCRVEAEGVIFDDCITPAGAR